MRKDNEYVVHLIRHGFSEGNRDNNFAGSTDVKLTDEGREELRQLREENEYPRGDIYAHSGLSRARESLEILYPEEYPNCLVLPEFKEIHFGTLEGKPAKAQDGEEYFRRWLLEEDLGYEEETFASMKERGYKGMLALLARLREQNGKSAVVLCHAIITRCILEAFQKKGIEEFFAWPAHNGRGYSLYFEEDQESEGGFRFVRVEPLFQTLDDPYLFK